MHHESVTVMGLSIQIGPILQPPTSISEFGEGSPYKSAEESLLSRGHSPSRYLYRATSVIGEFYDSVL